MPLMPKRVKFRKQQRGNRAGVAQTGNRLSFGEFGPQALDRAQLERQVDEAILMVHDRCTADVDFPAQILRPDGGVLLHEGAEQLDDRLAVQALVAHRPGDDLAHSFHFAEARKIQQNREGSEQLQAFREGAERCQSLGDLRLVVYPE